MLVRMLKKYFYIPFGLINYIIFPIYLIFEIFIGEKYILNMIVRFLWIVIHILILFMIVYLFQRYKKITKGIHLLIYAILSVIVYQVLSMYSITSFSLDAFAVQLFVVTPMSFIILILNPLISLLFNNSGKDNYFSKWYKFLVVIIIIYSIIINVHMLFFFPFRCRNANQITYSYSFYNNINHISKEQFIGEYLDGRSVDEIIERCENEENIVNTRGEDYAFLFSLNIIFYYSFIFISTFLVSPLPVKIYKRIKKNFFNNRNYLFSPSNF